MVLIVDSGSTKAIWAFVSTTGEVWKFHTEGINPCYMHSTRIESIIRDSLPYNEFGKDVMYIYFYSAGFYDEYNLVLDNVLSRFFPNAKICLAMDILGASRALLGREMGFAAILGTGTNTCIYDGERIVSNIDSLGFLLGDEGSGGYIGKRLLRDYIRGNMPLSVSELFYDCYHLSAEKLLLQLYDSKLPNKFCASFVPFLNKEMIEKEYADNLIRSSFRSFFSNIVCKYDRYQCYKLNLVGSIGWYFSNILEEVAWEFNMELGRVIQDPIEDLIVFHSV